jgi:hypothetical protein
MLFPTQPATRRRRIPSPPSRSSPLEPSVTPEIELLRPLLDTAANLDLADREGWRHLHDASREVVAVLVTGGRLPNHLSIGADDPPVLVARTLAAAWQHATDAWPQRQHRS